MKSIDFRNNQFLVGSILHAEELSITVVPAAANFGTHSKEFSSSRKQSNVCFHIYCGLHPYNYSFFTIKKFLYLLIFLKQQN
jgi:hypothetical protein